MKFTPLIAALAVTSLLTACAEQGGQPGNGVMQGGNVNKADVGTLAGAIGGGIIGSNIGGGKGAIAGTIAGTLLGGALGRSIGTSLDNADRAAYSQASQRALETAQPGQSLPWSNPNSGNSGSITPKGYYRNAQGDYCREYTQTIKVGGKTEQGFGTACRAPDGTWKIVE
ncbi:MAG: RT0821/Lpp0805 family surface protein [Alphaproteobacteria bacterium]|nr:RT0821/Lpp0805 family surface protein [Alphaproteobacteria bacterium]